MSEARAHSGASPALTTDAQQTAQMDYDEILKHRLVYGTPEQVVQRLREIKDRLELSGVVLEINFGGQIPQELVLNSIRLLAQEVMPRFK